MLCRDPVIPFSTEALQANLLRLQNEWERYKPAVSEMPFMDIWPPFWNWSHGGTRRARQSSVLIERCTCEGTNR